MNYHNEDQETRVHDYLDDKLQTDADLENIDVLLRNVLDQQELLRQQV
jgi:RAD50-interacting protein 1